MRTIDFIVYGIVFFIMGIYFGYISARVRAMRTKKYDGVLEINENKDDWTDPDRYELNYRFDLLSINCKDEILLKVEHAEKTSL